MAKDGFIDEYACIDIQQKTRRILRLLAFMSDIKLEFVYEWREEASVVTIALAVWPKRKRPDNHFFFLHWIFRLGKL
jgi:hypothetical protein